MCYHVYGADYGADYFLALLRRTLTVSRFAETGDCLTEAAAPTDAAGRDLEADVAGASAEDVRGVDDAHACPPTLEVWLIEADLLLLTE